MSYLAKRLKHIRANNLIAGSREEVRRRMKVIEQPTEDNPTSITCSPCFKHKAGSGYLVQKRFSSEVNSRTPDRNDLAGQKYHSV